MTTPTLVTPQQCLEQHIPLSECVPMMVQGAWAALPWETGWVLLGFVVLFPLVIVVGYMVMDLTEPLRRFVVTCWRRWW